MLARILVILTVIVTVIHPALLNNNNASTLYDRLYITTTFGILVWSILAIWIIYPIFLKSYIASKASIISNKQKSIIYEHTNEIKNMK